MARTTIHSDYIPDNAITGVKIAENSITAREIATNAITTLYIADDSITADKLANSINTDIATGPAALPKAGGTMTGALVVTGDANPALEVSRGSANTTNVNLKYNTTLTGQLSAADGKFQISASGSGTEMEFYTNGAKRVEIDTSGNVAIGSTVDALSNMSGIFRTLDSTGGDRTVAHFGAHNYGDTGKTFINIGTEYGDGTSRIGSFNNTGNSSVLVFDTHSATSGQFTERMRIGSNGKIGVATTSTDHQLTVNASAFDGIQLQSGGSDCGYLGVNTDTVYVGAGSNLIFHTGNAGLTNGSEMMRITSDGVGIGETSPAKLGLTGSSNGKVLHLGGDDCQLRLTYTVLHHDHSGNTTTHLRNHYGATDSLARIKYESGYHSWHTGTNFDEKMRLQGNNLLIGQTSSNLTYGKLQVTAGGEASGHGGIVGFFDSDVSVGSGNVIQVLWFSGDNDATGGVFTRYRDGNSIMGQVTAANGTQVSYGVSSDERLKENIVDASSQLNTIKNIKVREFDWKVNGYHEVGMIAQELNSVVPSVVQEGGDDISEEPWGVDYGKLTPYLVKAIQEQQTIIEDLKSRVETLEG
jgi:hypothetical protein